MEKILSLPSAYKVAFFFLKPFYYELGKPDEFGDLLGEMALVHNHLSADPAAFAIWIDKVREIAVDTSFFDKEKRKFPDFYSWRIYRNYNDKMEKILSALTAYDVMILFIEEFWQSWGETDRVYQLLDQLKNRKKDGLPVDPVIWERWLAAIEKVQNEDYEFS